MLLLAVPFSWRYHGAGGCRKGLPLLLRRRWWRQACAMHSTQQKARAAVLKTNLCYVMLVGSQSAQLWPPQLYYSQSVGAACLLLPGYDDKQHLKHAARSSSL
jgi:hypothetical protein